MKREKARSFRSQMHVILSLIGVIPYLLIIYILVREQMEISEIVLLVTPVIILFHFIGFYILRTFSDRLERLAHHISLASDADNHSSTEFNDNSVVEIREISDRFRDMVKQLEEEKQNFREVTVSLMKQAKSASSQYKSKISESEERESHLMPYIGANIVEQLLHNKTLEGPHLNSRREVSVLFSDIRAFTTIAESAEPEEVVLMLNEYFELMVEVIHKHSGVLDKYIGDELMAVFGLLPSSNETAIDAVNAAIEMQVALQQLMKKRSSEKKVTFSAGIGINSGVVIAGDIGSKERRDYTVIGDTVNVASRLVHIAKGTEILISRQTYNQCRKEFVTEQRGKTQVRNRREEVEFFKVISGRS